MPINAAGGAEIGESSTGGREPRDQPFALELPRLRSSGIMCDIELGKRIVTSLSLDSLWDEDDGPLRLAPRGRELEVEDVKQLLRDGPRAFVVADVGEPLRWVEKDVFAFWKNEVQPRLTTWSRQPELDDFPDGYFYVAEEWSGQDGQVVVLTKHH